MRAIDKNNRGPARSVAKMQSPINLAGGIQYILRQWRRHWRTALLVLLTMLIYELFKTLFALSLKAIIDNLQTPGQPQKLVNVLLALFVGFLVSFGARALGEKLIARIGVQILNQLRVKLFQHLQQLSQNYYARTPIGNILARFSSDLADIEKAATAKLRDGVLDAYELLLNIPVLFYLDWRLATLTLFFIILLTFGLDRFTPKATKAGYALKSAEAQLANEIQENTRAQAVIRAFGFEPLMLDRFTRQIAVLETIGVEASFLRALVSLLAKAGLALFRVAITGVGVWLVVRGNLTIGSLIAFINLLEIVNLAVDDLSRNVLPDFITATSGIQRIEELLQEVPDTVDRVDATPLPPLSDQIRLDHVSFSYTDHENNLTDINLTIPAGKSVAFVGPSGSGKSTLLTLLMRAHEASSGAILLDGLDIRSVQRASLQQQMAVVFQDTYLFNTTIAENIRMAKPTATDEEVEAAAKLAEIHDLIITLPKQYATAVGEAGGWLSGGQRQRVAIARAIIRNPAILILDEATSALDPSTEQAINATLQRLAQSRTVISVTHRLSSVTQADRIFVLQAGRLVASGVHAELLQQHGLYAELWQKQTGFEISADGRAATVHAAYLRHVTIFSILDTATLQTLAQHFSSEPVEEGQIVFRQGDVGDKLYLIARGQVEVLARDAQGEERRLDIMRDGDHFGEMALLQAAPRNATIRTLTDCLFLTLPKKEFLALLEELPAVRTAVDQQIERSRLNRARFNIVGEA
ncbi:MAG: ATP-binding cassette domain-containing protein [Chloroflexi bacterium]|nr:ATP-binding cassette domain-containing protein [Chloroflexota bacterium]